MNEIHSKDDDLPHFVFFYTTWSKYCVRVAPAWEDLADKYNNLVEKPVCIEPIAELDLCIRQDTPRLSLAKLIVFWIRNFVIPKM